MKTNSLRGFTLIETLVYLAIFSFIVAVVVPSFMAVEFWAVRQSATESTLADQYFVDQYVRNMVEHGGVVMSPPVGGYADFFSVRTHAGEILSITTNASGTLMFRGGHGGDKPLHDNGWSVEHFSVYRVEESFGESVTYSFNRGASSTIFLYRIK